MKATSFNLFDQDGKVRSYADYLGKWLIVYFYPKDDTPGCTKEACSFRDGSEEFKKLGVEIVGISKDSVSSHKKFQEKHKLNFTLLSDPDHKIIESYGAWGKKSMFGRVFEGIKRNTYIINPTGVIVKSYENVNPLKHSKQILKDLKVLIC